MTPLSFPLCSDSRAAADNLRAIINFEFDRSGFASDLKRLQKQFGVAVTTCPLPLPDAALILTPEHHRQYEIYLPLSEISLPFYRLYRAALRYSPIITSTPFHGASSWSDVCHAFPFLFQGFCNPATLLTLLLADRVLLTRFLFASFMPRRFYGGFGRYPRQEKFIWNWLRGRKMAKVRCLDAACGRGEAVYGLFSMLQEAGYCKEKIQIEGWSIEPLEVWGAAHGRFPHDPVSKAEVQRRLAVITEQRGERSLTFRSLDLTGDTLPEGAFDLILCNGFLGGPILHKSIELELVISRLAERLDAKGALLSADSFHGGWKQKCPQDDLRALFAANGLKVIDAGEGIAGLKPDK